MSIALILAAGKGTRMRSDLPKPVVLFNHKPIVAHIIDAMKEAGVKDIFLITGYGEAVVQAIIGSSVKYITQKEQKGTGHAVMQARDVIDWKHNNVFVFVGDSPLIKAHTIRLLEKKHIQSNASCTFLTSHFPIKLPYARVLKNDQGELKGCVEEKNATPEQLEITELLTSHFIFKGTDLFESLDEIKPDKDNGEYYLTDIIPLLLSKYKKIETVCIEEYTELTGLNTPEEIQWAEQFI